MPKNPSMGFIGDGGLLGPWVAGGGRVRGRGGQGDPRYGEALGSSCPIVPTLCVETPPVALQRPDLADAGASKRNVSTPERGDENLFSKGPDKASENLPRCLTRFDLWMPKASPEWVWTL